MILGMPGKILRTSPVPVLAAVGAWVALCAAVELFLLLDYDRFVQILLQLTQTRTEERIRQRQASYLVGPLILAAVPLLLVWLDAEARAHRKQSLLALLFSSGDGERSRHGRVISVNAVLTFILLPILVIVHLGRHPLGLHWVVDEDGPLEILTVVILLLSACGLLALAWRRRSEPGGAGYRAWPIVLGVLVAVLALEEISWGQRIFGWETGPMFERNIQNETNLHNLVDKNPFFYIFGTGAIFVVLYMNTLATARSAVGGEHRVRALLPDRSILIFWSVVFALSFEPLLDEFVEETFALAVASYVFQLHS